jgi:hypothetical protein
VIIRATQKLARKLKVGLEPEKADTVPESGWYANLFLVARLQYILVTHSDTLASVVIPGRGLHSADSFLRAFTSAVEDYFAYRGWTPLLGSLIEFDHSKASFRKTRNRRVLGSMNDMVLLVQTINPAKAHDLRWLNDNLNANILRYLSMGTPQDHIERLLRRA